MKCATHPDTETNLRCGKCGKPICPKCMMQTPVGARCPDCAELRILPTYQVPTSYYLRAIGAGLGLAIVCGFFWGLIRAWLPFFYLNLILSPAIGYVIGELTSRAVNRKRGTGLAIVAGITVAISYPVSLLLSSWVPLFPLNIQFLLIDLAALGFGIFIAIRYFMVK